MKRRYTSSPIVAIQALLATSLACAQPALEACLNIQQDAARLACYDQVAGREAARPVDADAAAGEALQALQEDRPDASVLDTLVQRSTLVFQRDSHDPHLQAIANAGRGSLLDSRWELAADSKLGLFNLRPYKPVYVLPAFWSSHPNESPTPSGNLLEAIENIVSIDDLESKFQISMKTKLLQNLVGTNGDLWLGYTQSSRWQVFNSDNSSPFRETNYEPELMLVFRNNYGIGEHWRGRMTGISINHQSNGRGDPISRSWNRVIFNFGFDREDWALMLRPWIRLSDSVNRDDNPDITDYIGRGDVTVTHVRGPHRFSLMGRHTLRGGDDSRGALQFDWGHQIHNDLRFHLQLFHGYGESLIDYNQKATYIGVGLSLVDWF